MMRKSSRAQRHPAAALKAMEARLLTGNQQLNQPTSFNVKRKRWVDDFHHKRSSKDHCLVTESKILPDDLIANILCRLPAEFLWEVCRYVCKGWSQILHQPYFVNSNISFSSGFEVLMQGFEEKLARMVGDPLSYLKFELTDREFKLRGLVLASFDGVLLIELRWQLYVTNPLTKQIVLLPPHSPAGGDLLLKRTCNITRVSKTGKFKVLCLGKERNDIQLLSWFVLTIGTNMSWTKVVVVPQEWCPTIEKSYRLHTVSVAGVFYAFDRSLFAFEKQTILAIDLCHDEPCVHILKNPANCRYKDVASCPPVIFGREHLGIINTRDEKADIWMLKDLYQSKWEMVKSVRFSYPSSWLSNPSFLLSSNSCHFCVLLESCQVLIVFIYDLHRKWSFKAYFFNTKEWQMLGVSGPREPSPASYIYRSSLVSLV